MKRQAHFLRRTAVASLSVGLALFGSIAAASGKAPGTDKTRAVVLVSGTAATTPFTTPTRACRRGYSAGNTWAFLRDYLVQRGYQVYTAPASVGGGVVQETSNEYDGPFADCPRQLPGSMTINGIGSVDQSAANLARFIRYLGEVHGVRSVDIVGHSLGGYIGRAGIRELRYNRVPVLVRSYATLGSPWDGAMLADPLDPADPLSACDGLPVCRGFLGALLPIPGIDILVANLALENAPVWNHYQRGALDGIPVTLVGGAQFTKEGGLSSKWPNDGAIQLRSALGAETPDAVLPHRRCHQFPMTHSLFVSLASGLPADTALTWSAAVGDVLARSFADADRALRMPNRIGCPSVP